MGKFLEFPHNTKTLREDRTAAEEKYVAYATRRRRRILFKRLRTDGQVGTNPSEMEGRGN